METADECVDTDGGGGRNTENMKPYRIDFWDSFERAWAGLANDSNDLAEAIAACILKQAGLAQGHRDCGEDYGP